MRNETGGLSRQETKITFEKSNPEVSVLIDEAEVQMQKIVAQIDKWADTAVHDIKRLKNKKQKIEHADNMINWLSEQVETSNKKLEVLSGTVDQAMADKGRPQKDYTRWEKIMRSDLGQISEARLKEKIETAVVSN